MIKYLKNIILIKNRTLFHVKKKSVKMQNLTKITKNRKNLIFITRLFLKSVFF
jgi:hypothetical protein